jgi:hypothetical protein
VHNIRGGFPRPLTGCCAHREIPLNPPLIAHPPPKIGDFGIAKIAEAATRQTSETFKGIAPVAREIPYPLLAHPFNPCCSHSRPTQNIPNQQSYFYLEVAPYYR